VGQLLIPQETYEHGEPWCNDINREKLLIHPPELSGNPTITVINNEILVIYWQSRMNWQRKLILPCKVSLSYFEGFFNML
jgi:hypothetical protein